MATAAAKKKSPEVEAPEVESVPAEETPAPAEPTPAEAAAEEAVDPNAPFKVPFRGVDFTVDRAILNDARFRMALASMQNNQIMYEALGPSQSLQFIALINRGETIDAIAKEFFASLNATAGWGNS